MVKLLRTVPVVAAMGFVLVLSGCASASGEGESQTPTSAPSQSSAPTQTSAACPDTLDAKVEADPAGTSGVYYLTFTNFGDTSCDVVGFPSVSWVSADGAPVGTSSQSDALSLAGTPISVAPGDVAYAWIHVVDAATSNGECASTPTPVAGLSVTVPGASASQTVTLDASVCSDPAWMSEVQVGPFDSQQQAASKGY